MQGQTLYPKQGGEQLVAGALKGDQTLSHLSLSSSGGYIVWQDNITDASGLGISARRINSNLSGELGTFRVSKRTLDHQQNPQVAVLKDGGAVFVWQNGRPGFQDVFARFLRPDGTFSTVDVAVNTYTEGQQMNPQVCALADGNVVVIWASMDQDGSLQGIYGQRLNAVGEKLGEEFRVNGTTYLNQRTPAVTALANGEFAVAWISEVLPVTGGTVTNIINVTAHVYARKFDAVGQAMGSEFRVNSNLIHPCANPGISGMSDGSITIAWGQRDISTRHPAPENPEEIVPVFFNSWDVYVRTYSGSGVALSTATRVNTQTFGDQYAPRISSLGTNQFVVWTSLGQDGFEEGVFGRFLAGGVPEGDELQINATSVSKQMQPAVASDGSSRILVAWSSFVGGENSFDLIAQQFASGSNLPLQSGAPYVSALSQSSLSITWPELAGYSGVQYELYINGSNTPLVLESNYYVLGGLAPSSLHSFALAYRLPSGAATAVSPTATGRTWGGDENFDGLPDDWQRLYWGNNPANWFPGVVDSDGDGVPNVVEFLNGTDPMDARSVLRTRISPHRYGGILNWETRPGFIYQIMVSTDLKNWNSYGSPRFAAGSIDSLLVEGGQAAFYRIVRVR